MLNSQIRDYQPLEKRDFDHEAEVPEKSSYLRNAPSRRLTVLFAISLYAHLITIFVYILPQANKSEGCLSPYSHLPSRHVIYEHNSEFTDDNETVADIAWDSLNVDAGAVALTDEFVSQHNLPVAARFPWDESRGLYYLEGFHNLHCLKLMGRSVSEYRQDLPQSLPKHHINHCLETLRQYVMCKASDLPIAALHGATDVSKDLQKRECRSWDSLVEWSTNPEREACWKMVDEYKTTIHNLEKFAYCRKESKYYPKMNEYFDVHGHKDPFTP